jgi:hypothetical protein
MMAMQPERKPEPADLKVVNDVQVWTHPDFERRVVQLRDKNGRVLASAAGVFTIHVGAGR